MVNSRNVAGKADEEEMLVCWQVAYCCVNVLVLSQDRSAETVVGAATLRYNLLIKHAVSPSHSILTLGQPVQILTPQCQLPEVPMCKSFI